MLETEAITAAPALPAIPDELRLDAENPWPGLTAFTEQQEEFFFGRDEEALELFECIKREPLTVLFGKSGLGKTSLLQAGIFPRLRASALLPVYVRLNYSDGAPRLEMQLRAALESGIQAANLAEVAAPQVTETVWEYLHRRRANLIDFEGRAVRPVLVFDQFEEWFTLGGRKEFKDELGGSFLPDLTDLIENRTPRALAEKLARDRELARRYDLDAPGCKILITLREDYMADLEALRQQMPSLVFCDNRMQLREMNGRQAFSVVADPNPDLVAKDVAEFITRFVAGSQTEAQTETRTEAQTDAQTEGPAKGGHPAASVPLKDLVVAPAILSLFCRQLNEERRKRGLPRITRDLVAAQGVTIIDDFYLQCIANMHPSVRRMIEDQLLTKAGYRDNIDLSQAKWELEQAGAAAACIDDLVKLRLLQVEEHRGIPRLELTHDVLAEPVRRSRTLWEEEVARRQQEQAQERLLREEREALVQARQETRMRRVIAGVAIVVLVLAVLLINATYSVYQHHALATTAEKLKSALVKERQFREEAETNAKEAEILSGIAAANAAKADVKAKEAEENARNLERVTTHFVNHCVDTGMVFYALGTGKERDVRDTLFKTYELLLMNDDQCFDIAQKAHRIMPENLDLTDSLTMVPINAADSARKRGDTSDVKKYCDSAVKLAESLEREPERPGVGLLIARTYMAVAFELAEVNDPAANAIAERGERQVEGVRRSLNDSFSARDWDNLSDVYVYEAGFQKAAKNSAAARKAYEESFNAEARARKLAPEKTGYLTGAMNLGTTAGDYEQGLDNNDAAVKWYRKALALAQEAKDRPTIATIYRDERVALVAGKKYSDARKLFEDRIRSLKAEPKDNQREQDLAMAYADAAEVEEAQKLWPAAMAYRAQGAAVLDGLKPKAYKERSKDLILADADLAWAEIFAGQMGNGLADSKKGVAVAEEIKDRDKLAYNYENTIKALLANKHYEEAHAQADLYIGALLKQDDDVQRAQSLYFAYRKAAEAEEDLNDWPRAVEDYKQVVAVLRHLNEKHAYDDATKDLASALGGLAWAEIQAGSFNDGLKDAKEGLAVDPTQAWIQVNEAHGLLLTGDISGARDLYLRIKSLSDGKRDLVKDVHNDFLQICKLGYARPEMAGIAHDLGIDDAELKKCLASTSQTR